MGIAKQYINLGFSHVIPLGLDHILFILALILISENISSIFVQCSIFTIAHGISLGLSAVAIIMVNSKMIETLIQLTILFTAIDNINNKKSKKWRLVLVFIFGLIHGFGFANALKNIGLSDSHFLASLLCFNAGVELGQIAVIVFAYFSIGYWFSKKEWYKKRIVYPVSSLIACIALYWTFERILLN